MVADMQLEPNLQIIESELSLDTQLFLERIVEELVILRLEVAQLRRSNNSLANLVSDKVEKNG